jgi:hypothetical protein
VSARIASEWERHYSRPEADGGIIWFSRPVFDRADYYTMLIAARVLDASALVEPGNQASGLPARG